MEEHLHEDDSPDEPEDRAEEPEGVELPIDGTLDLHVFLPAEVRRLVPDYLEECRVRGISEVRLIHGKGTGQLRDLVHSILRTHPAVISFHTPTDASGWGATVVQLDISH